MERLGTLITKLKEQFEQKAEPEKLLITTQLIMAELQQHQSQDAAIGKVSVTMPVSHHTTAPTADIHFVDTKPQKSIPSKKEENTGWLFDPLETIPTLAHQDAVTKTEVNDALSLKKESLNDQLKIERIELATALHATPVKDLKKAIGLNDRYLFISELFRGDENMYERSIKTINSFSIYPEAQYWIQRELKVKLGWNEGNAAVVLFDQIVKRRFS